MIHYYSIYIFNILFSMWNLNEINEVPENLEEEWYSNEFEKYVTCLEEQRKKVWNIINK